MILEPQIIASIIASILSILGIIFSGIMYVRKKNADTDNKNEESDRAQNVELVKNLQVSDQKKQKNIDEMQHRIEDLYAGMQTVLRENVEIKAELAYYKSQREVWQRERDVWQRERETWQRERSQYDFERANWHAEKQDLTRKVNDLETQLDALKKQLGH
jgi:chromosome segregation ATPase